MFAVENFSFRAPGRFAVVFLTFRGNLGKNYTMLAVENFSFRAPGRFAVVFFTLRGNSIFQGFTSGADR